jgi:hypothetical protein
MKEDSNEMNQHPPAPTSTNTTNGLEKDKPPTQDSIMDEKTSQHKKWMG